MESRTTPKHEDKATGVDRGQPHTWTALWGASEARLAISGNHTFGTRCSLTLTIPHIEFHWNLSDRYFLSYLSIHFTTVDPLPFEGECWSLQMCVLVQPPDYLIMEYIFSHPAVRHLSRFPNHWILIIQYISFSHQQTNPPSGQNWTVLASLIDCTGFYREVPNCLDLDKNP